MNMNDSLLIDRFVESFARLDDDLLTASEIPQEMESPDVSGAPFKKWRPIKWKSPPFALDEFYRNVPARLPVLYEQLILSYHWLNVDLQIAALIANPPGLLFERLTNEIKKDAVFVEVLFPRGLIQFAWASGGSYDPICFDCQHQTADGDCKVVRLDHEEILCTLNVRRIHEIAPSFRSLIHKVIAL